MGFLLVDDVSCVVGIARCFRVVLLVYLVYVPLVYPFCIRVVPTGFYRLEDGPGRILVKPDQVNNGPYVPVGYWHEGARGAPRRSTIHPSYGSSAHVFVNDLSCGGMFDVGTKFLGRVSSDSSDDGFRRALGPAGLCPIIEWADVGICRSRDGFHLSCYRGTMWTKVEPFRVDGKKDWPVLDAVETWVVVGGLPLNAPGGPAVFWGRLRRCHVVPA